MGATFKRLIPESWKKPWRDLQWRVQQLERRLGEADRLLDIVITEEVFAPDSGLEMNGQTGRKEIVQDLFRRIPFVSAVETGTYLGNTTGYLSSVFHVPVYSCELLPRYHHAARRLLRNLPDIHLQCGDARTFLAHLPESLPPSSDPVFFYLDAHWYDDLPLVEELESITNRWRDFVVMIDDFEVPGDPGYGFDRYGDRALNADLLRPVVAGAHLQIFFPALPSDRETGRKRGCAIVASPSLATAVAASAFVRSHAE